MAVRTALYYHQQHPEITFRTDALLLGIYRTNRAILSALQPETELPPDYDELQPDFLSDMSAFFRHEQEYLEEEKRKREKERMNKPFHFPR